MKPFKCSYIYPVNNLIEVHIHKACEGDKINQVTNFGDLIYFSYLVNLIGVVVWHGQQLVVAAISPSLHNAVAISISFAAFSHSLSCADATCLH